MGGVIMKVSFSREEHGWSMLEVLMAMGVGAILLLATQSQLIQLAVSQRRLDLKSEVISLKGYIQSMLAQPGTCRQLLRLATSPLEFAQPYPAGQALSGVSWAETTLNTGQVYRGLRLEESTLTIPQQTSTTHLQVQLKLRFIEIESPAYNSQRTHVIENPLLLVLGANPANNGNTQLVQSCVHSTGASEHRETCAGMGGRWLEATEPGTHMPRPRCSFGASLELLETELPNGIPDDGSRLATGERVDECYYRPYAINTQTGQVNRSAFQPTVRTYACNSIVGNRRAYRCSYSMNMRRWTIQLWDQGQPNGQPLHICTAGVRVSQRDQSIVTLNWDEPISVAYPQPNPTPQNSQNDITAFREIDRLKSVTRCKYLEDQERHYVCAQASNEASALEGKGGSCIFVRNAKLFFGTDSGSTTRRSWVDTYNGLNSDHPINVNSYTGWIYVMTERQRTPFTRIESGIRKWKMHEGSGIPCFQVEVDTNLGTESGLAHSGPHPESASVASDVRSLDGGFPSLSFPNLAQLGYLNIQPAQLTQLYQEPARIKQCLHVGTMHDSTRGQSAGVVEPYNPNSSVMQVLDCDNSALDPYLGSGDPHRDLPESVTAGSCLFVRNVRLSNSYTPNTQTYTGWVRFIAPIPSALTSAIGTAQPYVTDYYVPSLTPPMRGYLQGQWSPTLSALPCNGGIRYDASPSSPSSP